MCAREAVLSDSHSHRVTASLRKCTCTMCGGRLVSRATYYRHMKNESQPRKQYQNLLHVPQQQPSSVSSFNIAQQHQHLQQAYQIIPSMPSMTPFSSMFSPMSTMPSGPPSLQSIFFMPTQDPPPPQLLAFDHNTISSLVNPPKPAAPASTEVSGLDVLAVAAQRTSEASSSPLTAPQSAVSASSSSSLEVSSLFTDAFKLPPPTAPMSWPAMQPYNHFQQYQASPSSQQQHAGFPQMPGQSSMAQPPMQFNWALSNLAMVGARHNLPPAAVTVCAGLLAAHLSHSVAGHRCSYWRVLSHGRQQAPVTSLPCPPCAIPVRLCRRSCML